MKTSLLFLILFIGTISVSLLLPWWIIAPIAAALTYSFKTKAVAGFIISLSAVFLAWLLSIYIIDDGTVADLMGKLFEVSGFATPRIGSLLGGLVAGLFGLAGALLAPQGKAA
jgi:hypothetical protein